MEKVSIIMPVFNGGTTLAKSLKSLLSQTANFFELIIVNDASSDNSLEIIKKFANALLTRKGSLRPRRLFTARR